MKKTLLSFTLIFGFLVANAQLSFLRSDFTKAPAKYNYLIDTSFVLPNVYATGAGLVWDFTKAKSTDKNVTIFHVASKTPDHNKFPEADMALQRDSAVNLLYYIKDGKDSIVVIGSTDPNIPDLHFRTLIFPLKLNTTWDDKGSRIIRGKGADYGYPQADSVKVTVNYQVLNKAEAEGELKLATGEIDALKLRTINKITFTAQAKLGIWFPIPGLLPDIIDTTYSFFAKNHGYALVSMQSNKNGSFYVNHQELSKNNASVSSVIAAENIWNVYPNPANDILNFKNQEANNYCITDMIGREIMKGKIENQIIDISKLATGNYIIQIFKNNEINGIQKFIKH